MDKDAAVERTVVWPGGWGLGGVLLAAALLAAGCDSLADASWVGKQETEDVTVSGEGMIEGCVEGGQPQPLRLNGIRPAWDPEPGAEPRCAEEASAYANEAFAGGKVELEFDVVREDADGALLVWVWTGGELLNAELVRVGLASKEIRWPNIAHASEIEEAEEYAHEHPSFLNCAPGEPCPGSQCCDPDCEGKTCGDDGCGWSCGSCEQGATCYEGHCVTCAPQCSGKNCGDDGCGGVCGNCGAGEKCEQGQCVCVSECLDKECGDDGCGGSCGTCAEGLVCKEGMCECVPQCDGKECGDDGCGGICGFCEVDQYCVAGSCAVCECPVQFEDPALKEALLMLLPGDLDGEPCAGEFDAAEITDVSMQDVGIFSLEGFQCFRADGLTVVRLQHNAIRDVSPLADFAGLTQLYLVDNWIQDLSYLSGLTSLTYLSLSDNDVSNLAPLAALTALQTLYLSNNFIVKVTALTSLVDLGKAELSSNFITDIGPLVGLQKLVSLNLNQNHIHDLPSFQCLGELKTLEVVKNKITDLAGLVNSNGLAGPGVSVKVTSNPIDCAGQVDNIRTLVCCWGIVLTTTCPAPTAAECAEADCASHPVPPCQ